MQTFFTKNPSQMLSGKTKCNVMFIGLAPCKVRRSLWHGQGTYAVGHSAGVRQPFRFKNRRPGVKPCLWKMRGLNSWLDKSAKNLFNEHQDLETITLLVAPRRHLPFLANYSLLGSESLDSQEITLFVNFL